MRKAQFKVIKRITRFGLPLNPGRRFDAGIDGSNVRRWLKEGRVVIINPPAWRREDKP